MSIQQSLGSGDNVPKRNFTNARASYELSSHFCGYHSIFYWSVVRELSRFHLSLILNIDQAEICITQNATKEQDGIAHSKQKHATYYYR